MSRYVGIFLYLGMSDDRRKFPELRVRGIGDQLRNKLQNIADHQNVRLSELLKTKLWDIANSYPPEMQTPKKD